MLQNANPIRASTSLYLLSNCCFPLLALQVEQPIPEQFVTVIQPSGKMATTVSDLYSS